MLDSNTEEVVKRTLGREGNNVRDFYSPLPPPGIVRHNALIRKWIFRVPDYISGPLRAAAGKNVTDCRFRQ